MSCCPWPGGRAAEIIEVNASHVPMMSQPGVVTGVILKAVKAVA